MNGIALRKIKSALFVGFCLLSVLLALTPVALIFFFVVSQGIQALNVDFFTQVPRPVGELGGGMANAIVGTLILIGLAALFAVPVGCICGIHLSEYPNAK